MIDIVQLSLPFIVLGVVLAFFAAAWLFSRNYIKVSPNLVAVLSGRRRKLPETSVSRARRPDAAKWRRLLPRHIPSTIRLSKD